MAVMESTRPTTALAPEAAAMPGGADPGAFTAGTGPEDRLIAQVAFALAAEKGLDGPPPETVQALRDQAAAALSDFAFRYLHNRVEEIRREALAEARAAQPRPLGFGAAVLANLIALALAGAVGMWMAAHPQAISGLVSAL